MRVSVALPLLLLAMPASADVLPGPEPMLLTCAAPFTKDASHASLAEHFGKENVAFERVPGPEGSTFDVTVIFPKDPKKRVEISWHDETKRSGLLAANVRSEGSEWVAPGGITLGTPIGTVEKLNGKPFKLSGFSWDMWGWVRDWMGGTMVKIVKDAGCTNLTLRFDVENEAAGIGGEGPFLSNGKAMLSSKPYVVEFGIGYGFAE